MPLGDGDEGRPARGSHLTARRKGGLHGGSIIGRVHDLSAQAHRVGRGGRTPEADGKLAGHGGRRSLRAAPRHEVLGRGPVGVTVKERANDATVEHPAERFQVRRGGDPLADHGSAIGVEERTDAQALFIGWPAPEADAVGRVTLLQTRTGLVDGHGRKSTRAGRMGGVRCTGE